MSKLDHAAADLSTSDARTTAERDAERDNQVRLGRARGPRRGHVESHFLKANSPDGRRALWIKHTVRIPRGRPEAAVAELWAISFDDGGARKVAAKATFPLHQARFDAAPFALRVPSATLTRTRAHGALRQPGAVFHWDLTLTPVAGAAGAPFRPFPLDRMYTGAFPRSKSLTPAPDLRITGELGVNGTTWTIDRWRGAQGHNWGASHAHAYAWVHANAWCDEGSCAPREATWLEALSGRTRLPGGLVTPWLSVAALSLDGELLRFDGPRALATQRRWVDARSYAFEVRSGGATLHAEFRAEADQLAGLRYDDPDGSMLACLNAKIARGTLRLTRGRRTLHLHTAQAALELGTRDPAHGIALLA
ncbi:MAG: hypothetical protein ABW252_25550 [Polyangiales bacterium]